MKVVILAGGLGSRISEETVNKPKPMVEIGGMPILWHIMKIYSGFGFNDFIICCGYKGHIIKKFFLDYSKGIYSNSLDIDYTNTGIKVNNVKENWKVSLINTGRNTLTARRLYLVKKYLNNEDFMLTYGDGVSDVDINKLLKFHRENGTIATITGAKPDPRFGTIDYTENNIISSFKEKSSESQGYVNIGYMVFNKEIFRYINEDNVMLEKDPFNKLVNDKQLSIYKHDGFFAPMDTLKDKIYLEELYNNNQAKWKRW